MICTAFVEYACGALKYSGSVERPDFPGEFKNTQHPEFSQVAELCPPCQAGYNGQVLDKPNPRMESCGNWRNNRRERVRQEIILERTQIMKAFEEGQGEGARGGSCETSDEIRPVSLEEIRVIWPVGG